MNNYNYYLIDSEWQKVWRYIKHNKFIDYKIKDSKYYSIDTPPPTVSGTLHIGHLLSYTQIDFIARFRALKGRIVFFPIGFDNNGLPTEKLLEKCFSFVKNKTFRIEFFLICKEVINSKESEFKFFFISIGLSIDWNYQYKTIDYWSQKFSQISFIDLYFKNYLTKTFWPTFWDIKDQTAISQAEHVEVKYSGNIYSIIFCLEKSVKIFISTNLPEMFFACVAIFFNKYDLRYKNFLKKQSDIFLFNFSIPILHSYHVDINYGTGIIMCSTFSDSRDIMLWKKHSFPIIDYSTFQGKIKNSPFLDSYNSNLANRLVLFMLGLYNLLSFSVNILQTIKISERSKKKLEIILTSQWYIQTITLNLNIFIKVKWYPKFMLKKLSDWIQDLNNNWCISRQRYFGIPIPIWYSNKTREQGKILLPDINNLPINPSLDLPFGYDKSQVQAETDLLDTWATSSITPQLLNYFIFRNLFFDQFSMNNYFPFDLRPQGHEIIRTWTFYTLARSLIHKSSIPWKNLMISGWCILKSGVKMSKSLNNTINPLKLINSFGIDILRYWVSTSILGVDMIYNSSISNIASKLFKKINNASKFIHHHTLNIKILDFPLTKYLEEKKIICDIDKWILCGLLNAFKNILKLLSNYEYFYARMIIEKFFIHDFCHDYIEVIKKRVYNSIKNNFKRQFSGKLTLYFAFYHIINIFSPFFPHFVEEINLLLYSKAYKIIYKLDGWKNIDNFMISKQKLYSGRCTIKFLELIRKYKSINMLSLNSMLGNIYISGTKISNSSILDLKNVVNCDNISYKCNLHRVTLKSSCKNYLIQVTK